MIMSNKLTLVLFLLLNIHIAGLSQENYLNIEAQFGTFSMTDLKNFQERVIPDIGVNIESVSSFPPYVGYGVSILSYINSEFGIGLTTEFLSTGGRNYYEDYSGYYKCDMLTHCFNIGSLFSFRNKLSNDQNLNIELHQGLKISSLTLRETIFTTEPLTDQKMGFKSLSWWVKGGFRYEYSFFDYFTAGAFVGGEFNIGSRLESRDNPGNYILRENNEFARINWTGFRAALSLSVDLSILSSER